MANNILYIADGGYGSINQARRGRLTPLVQGQYGQVVPLEIRDLADSVENLTGYSTITALLQKGSTVIEVTGTLELTGTPAAGPNVNWTVAEEDTGTFGEWYLVVRLSNGSNMLKTIPLMLTIVRDPEANATGGAMVVGVTAAERALLTDMYNASQAADAGEAYVFDGAGGGAEGSPSAAVAWGDVTGTLADQTDVQAALDDKADSDVATTQQAGASYTFALADKGKVVQSTNGSATTFTVPANATVAFPVGSVIGFEQYGAGLLSIAAAGGVTIRNPHAGLDVSAQYGGGALRKIATDEWMITGMLE